MQRPGRQTPNNTKEQQAVLEDAAQEDSGKQTIERRAGLSPSLVQGRRKQCPEVTLCTAGTRKVGMYKIKDGNRDGRISPPKPEMPEVTSKQESTTTTRITAQGGSRGLVLHEAKHKATRTMDSRTR